VKTTCVEKARAAEAPSYQPLPHELEGGKGAVALVEVQDAWEMPSGERARRPPQQQPCRMRTSSPPYSRDVSSRS
jgi:hypothetical protein